MLGAIVLIAIYSCEKSSEEEKQIPTTLEFKLLKNGVAESNYSIDLFNGLDSLKIETQKTDSNGVVRFVGLESKLKYIKIDSIEGFSATLKGANFKLLYSLKKGDNNKSFDFKDDMAQIPIPSELKLKVSSKGIPYKNCLLKLYGYESNDVETFITSQRTDDNGIVIFSNLQGKIKYMQINDTLKGYPVLIKGQDESQSSIFSISMILNMSDTYKEFNFGGSIVDTTIDNPKLSRKDSLCLHTWSLVSAHFDGVTRILPDQTVKSITFMFLVDGRLKITTENIDNTSTSDYINWSFSNNDKNICIPDLFNNCLLIQQFTNNSLKVGDNNENWEFKWDK